MYNNTCRRNPAKARFLSGDFTGGCAHFYIHRFHTEFMKGGVLMKSKHYATYGKKIAVCSFRDFHTIDNLFHKSRITASAKTVIR